MDMNMNMNMNTNTNIDIVMDMNMNLNMNKHEHKHKYERGHKNKQNNLSFMNRPAGYEQLTDNLKTDLKSTQKTHLLSPLDFYCLGAKKQLQIC